MYASDSFHAKIFTYMFILFIYLFDDSIKSAIRVDSTTQCNTVVTISPPPWGDGRSR